MSLNRSLASISSLALALLFLGACVQKATAPEQKSSAVAGSTSDIKTFHLSDPEGPKIVDQELETIPTEVNPAVEKWIGYFTGKGRRHMERYLARSTRYEKLMKKVLRDAGVPEDLFYIALIESGFSSRAVSHASAVGYWQFIRGTGKRYGLRIDRLVDDRRDPVLATEAAADYFRGLYSVFGSWYLAMASYNVGENRVKKETLNHSTRDFWELARKGRLPRETVSYVPKFIAAKLIAKDPVKYGFDDIDYLPGIEFETIAVDHPVNLRVMAEKMNYNYEDFKALNPVYKGEIAPLHPATNKLELRIPPGQRELSLTAARDSLVDKVEYVADAGDTQPYRIRRGDNLSFIARRFRTTVAYLRDINDIPKGRRLKVGSVIYVPDRTPLKDRKDRSSTASAPRKVSPGSVAGGPVTEGTRKYHIVQSGDSLFTIARKYGTTIDELSRVNNIRRGKILKLGAKLRIPGGDEETQENESGKNNAGSTSGSARKTVVHVVKRGESLSVIAERYQVPMKDIKRRNGIRNPAALVAGARLVIPHRD